MIDLGKTYVVRRPGSKFHGWWVTPVYLREDKLYTCNFIADDITANINIKAEYLVTPKEWNKYEESRKDKIT